MSVKVSVVVPVYNPGTYIEGCIESVLDQSLPADEYEAIFVDDGSTDETPARLDRLAAEHANVHVIHIPNSGWPGKPRNVGIDAAVGEFIQFVDHDDRLGPEALQRMYEYGVANASDVIIGKMAGQGRGVPRELFRTNRPWATVDNAPLIDSLTPHKMFRRQFLTETGLRFPEGRRRLEDHVFVTEAFLRASNVSVLSDYVCYYHVRRDDAANAGLQLFDPVGYFANLREALDVVERFTEPGRLRDKLYRRWFRNEMVERLRGTRMINWPDDFRIQLFCEIHKLAVERFGPGVIAGLQPAQQIVAALIMADQLDELVALAHWEIGLSASTFLRDVAWVDGALRVAFDAELHSHAAPMTLLRERGVERLDPPLSAAGREALAAHGADIVARANQARADIVVRHRETSVEYLQPVQIEREFVGRDDRLRLLIRTVATIDPRTGGAGEPLTHGIWDFYVRVSANGWTSETKIGAARTEDPAVSLTGAVVGDPAALVLPYWTAPRGDLALDVAQKTARFATVTAGLTPAQATTTERELRITLPLYVPVPTAIVVRFTDTSTRQRTEATGVLDVNGVLTTDLPARGWMGSLSQIAVHFPAPTGSAPRYTKLGIALDTRGRGLPRVIAVKAMAPAGASRYTPRRVVAALRRRAGRLKRRLIG